MPYFPLASGVLTGKYRQGQEPPRGHRASPRGATEADEFASDEKLDVVERLEAYAKAHGHTLPELALSWLAGHADGRRASSRAPPRPSRCAPTPPPPRAWEPHADAERAEVDALARVGG